MNREKYQQRAFQTIVEMANDEEVYAQTMRVRQSLEAAGVGRGQLIQYCRQAFMQLTMANDPDIDAEELEVIANSKTDVFMWLIDNV